MLDGIAANLAQKAGQKRIDKEGNGDMMQTRLRLSGLVQPVFFCNIRLSALHFVPAEILRRC